ncbi:basic amino acid ABC transporter substrate-binding protein [Nocardioides marmoribigeumensis]|uniref:Polar amino acid transport system substrate-binding protein n=1 Tax=Nocardioides marmoribigeumensis TaxID=433649 RepID=A0ABU2C0E8_9ACTN|nr:basic amino acid ABC transporter substrate-binding protein [Nocardioides marmoribigeumensis]MDR7364118.1 polar amino acid transport system substrate-binding protein [Nocardioides marmoribigeumensis]
MTRLRSALSLAAASSLVLAMSACATDTKTTKSGVKVVNDGKLTVCTSLPYKPFEFKQNGQIVGFDMDLMKEVAKANNLDVKIEITGFEGIQSGQSLNAGKCDIAAAGMTITPEREKAIDFTDPYFDASQALLTKDQSLDSLEALKGKSLAVMSGTTGELYAKQNAPKDVKLKSFEDLGLQTTALKTGQVDAVIQDNGPLLDFAKSNKGTYVTAEFNTGESYGFAVQKGNNDKLLESANKVIKDLKSSGKYDTIYKKWFGTAPKK